MTDFDAEESEAVAVSRWRPELSLVLSKSEEFP